MDKINNDYFLLSTKLSYLSNDEIKNIIKIENEYEYQNKRSGINKIYKFNNTNIFIKAIPIAKLFIENRFDTKNLYDIPAYYNYGFGSAGVNPWRELLLHIKTSNFVLMKKCDFFPLLYHYRIIKDDDNRNIASLMDERILKKWNNNKNIIKYLQDRIHSKFKIVLFLEYIPNVSYKYLEQNPYFVESFYKQTKNIISFINKNGILHNDAHLGNFLVDDNKKVYLSDFGLSLDDDFNLDNNEKKFKQMNNKLDEYYIVDNIMSDYLHNCLHYDKIKKKYNLGSISSFIELHKYLIDNIDIIKNDITISEFQISFIKKKKSMIMNFLIWRHKFKNSEDKNNYFISNNINSA